MNTHTHETSEDTGVDALYAEMRCEVTQKFKNADPTAMELIFNLLRAADSVQRRTADMTRAFDLTPTALNVLGLLDHRKDAGLPFHEISQLLLVSRANVTGLVDSLESKGLVERKDHETDRRVYLAKITKKGRSVLTACRGEHLALIKEVTGVLRPDEKKQLIDLLTKWRRGMS